MFQNTQDYVPSPCINLCQLDRDGRFCRGCYRSLDEIAAWSRVSNAEKRVIVASAARRREEFGASAP
jgi:predicted Fe-S protein YdhL (DUF1289 family)